MIRVHSINELMDKDMNVRQINVTFQRFEGNLSFNVTIPLVADNMPEGSEFNDMTRNQIIQLARETIAEMILVTTVNPEEPPLTEFDPDATPVEPTPGEEEAGA